MRALTGTAWHRRCTGQTDRQWRRVTPHEGLLPIRRHAALEQRHSTKRDISKSSPVNSKCLIPSLVPLPGILCGPSLVATISALTPFRPSTTSSPRSPPTSSASRFRPTCKRLHRHCSSQQLAISRQDTTWCISRHSSPSPSS